MQYKIGAALWPAQPKMPRQGDPENWVCREGERLNFGWIKPAIKRQGQDACQHGQHLMLCGNSEEEGVTRRRRWLLEPTVLGYLS